MSKKLKENIRSKTVLYIDKISKEYLDLIRLELDIFRIILLCEGFPVGDNLIHITISNDDEKINKRRKILYSTFYLQKQDLIDSYFMKIGKLFDITNNNKTISLANFIIFLEKNIRFFDQQEEILKCINIYKADYEKLNLLMIKLRNHRDKCLAHNNLVIKCQHLDDFSSKDTSLILNMIFDFIFSFNNIFGKKTIDIELVQKIKGDAMTHNYMLLKQLEADV